MFRGFVWLDWTVLGYPLAICHNLSSHPNPIPCFHPSNFLLLRSHPCPSTWLLQSRPLLLCPSQSQHTATLASTKSILSSTKPLLNGGGFSLGFAFITVTTGTRCNSTHDGHLSMCWMVTDKQTPAKKQEQNEDNEEDTDDGDDIYKLIPVLNFNHRSIG